MSKIDETLREQLTAVLRVGISDDGMKPVKKAVDEILYQIESDIEYRLKDELAPNLAAWVVEMAQRAVEQLLAGNEEMMRSYLSCKENSWTGRSTGYSFGNRRPEDWHSVIHGNLFEQGCVKLRKDIVDAHRELLVNERILDLEDQVKSLVAQVNKANQEREAMWERVRGCGA